MVTNLAAIITTVLVTNVTERFPTHEEQIPTLSPRTAYSLSTDKENMTDKEAEATALMAFLATVLIGIGSGSWCIGAGVFFFTIFQCLYLDVIINKLKKD